VRRAVADGVHGGIAGGQPVVDEDAAAGAGGQARLPGEAVPGTHPAGQHHQVGLQPVAVRQIDGADPASVGAGFGDEAAHPALGVHLHAQRGELDAALAVTTTPPKRFGDAPYEDRFEDDSLFSYHYRDASKPTEAARQGAARDNEAVRRALREQLPTELLDQKRIYRKDLPAELYDAVWELFRDGIAPLHAAGKLGAVFLQYPRWFFPSNESRDEIVKAKERLGDTPFAVELRHASWFNEKNAERTLRFLEDNQIPFVMVDGPQGLRSSIPPVVAATSSSLAVVRFHGRRVETWEKSGIPVVERFRYLYDGDELGEWVPRIREASRQVRETHILMNNCYANYGTTNAREIAQMLRQADAAAT
jgi:uncharacterized protein YecE (DUF72 family)